MIASPISSEAFELIRQSEGLSLTSYLCPAGKWTIGYGHTRSAKAGQVIDAAAAEALLRADIAATAITVRELVQVKLTESQFSALVSFTYNVGPAAFARSRLLKKLNAGDYAAVPQELSRWVYSRGHLLQGLVTRRAREAALWQKEGLPS